MILMQVKPILGTGDAIYEVLLFRCLWQILRERVNNIRNNTLKREGIEGEDFIVEEEEPERTEEEEESNDLVKGSEKNAN